MIIVFRRLPARGSLAAFSGTSSDFTTPSGVNSKAQARNSVTGRPISKKIIKTRITDSGAAKLSVTMSATCTNNQPAIT